MFQLLLAEMIAAALLILLPINFHLLLSNFKRAIKFSADTVVYRPNMLSWLAVCFVANYDEEFDALAGSEQDVEYELEEVWDGAKWHVVHKMVPKKTDTGNFVR